ASPRLQPARLHANAIAPDDTLSLSRVFIDPELLPRQRLTECIRSVLRIPGIHTFYDAQGYAPLRQLIAERLRRRGIPAAAEHLIITTGSQQALDIVCRALAEKSIATENPAYFLAKRLFEMNSLAVTGLSFDPFRGVDVDAWSRQLRSARPSLLYLTTNFHNPTGYSHTSEGLEAILRIAAEIPMGILEDDWGSDMLSFSEFRPPLRALGGPHVLYMNSFTKKLLPSMRVGYLLGNEQTVSALVEAKRVSTLGNPMLMEVSLFEFLDRGYYDTHLEALQRALDVRYRLCIDLLRRTMPEGVSWTTPGGGPLLWVEVPRAVDLTRLARNLAAQRVSIDTSRESFFGEPHLHGFKLGYAYPTPEQLETGIPRLARAIARELERA
ncbi:MAG TPA: PLP-dependent aminotransferase family protein, partial [Thermoanaerobaculia bacterium]|nr:PLP-dependent aminotransferase family protein [Thermoanaerobaculia bacterium]